MLLPKQSLNFRTGWSVGEHAFAWSSKHTLPRLARSTLNELQQNQHEKASLVCVRVQSPSGMALVPCALSMVDLSGQLRCWITHTYLVQKNVLFFIFGTLCSYHPLWRGFFFLGKPRKKRLASLARLMIIVACETRLTENGIPPERNLRMVNLISVSYTHLTLPTIYSV